MLLSISYYIALIQTVLRSAKNENGEKGDQTWATRSSLNNRAATQPIGSLLSKKVTQVPRFDVTGAGFSGSQK